MTLYAGGSDGGTGATAEQRVLVLTPTAKDAALTQSILARAGVPSCCCGSLPELCAELDAGAAAILLPEETVLHDDEGLLVRRLARQEPWSDLPVLLFAQRGADSPAVARAMDMLGNVTVLERPTRVSALVSAVRSALRARQRQYQIREHLLEREHTAATLLTNDRRKDEFLAILAHELRNPLAPIVNSIQVLRLTTDDPRLKRLGDILERQVHHMVRLVDDLLEVSRITRGKIELRKERIDLASILRSAVESARPGIEAAGHRLTVSMPARPLILDADPVRLAQVFANLLNNACKYTDSGGNIDLVVEPADDRVVVRVRDNGCGIPADKLATVFELFTQLDHDAARKQGGLGIGLTLVKMLVEMHGGTVAVASEGFGRGSDFLVDLPLMPGETGSQTAGAALPAPLPHQRMLVVDDNRDAADTLASLLRLLGAEVQVAYGGPEALALAASWQPAVMLLDIGMPGMDGHEVARRVRRLPGMESLKLIAMTGWGQEQDRRRTEEAGFDHHLTKPANVEVLSPLLFAQETPSLRDAKPAGNA